MQHLDKIKCKKILAMGYKGLKVKSVMGNFAYIAFVPEKEYEKFHFYPNSSAMFKHTAHFIYDFNEERWTKFIHNIEITPTERVLYGRT